MRRGYTAQAVRDAEAPHLAAGEPLMERAAHALAEQIALRLEGSPADGRAWLVVLLVGSGSNGGDALLAGAELAGVVVGGAGVEVVAIGVGSRMHGGGRSAASAAGVRLESPDPTEAARLAVRADVVVDGILGTGTSTSAPALRGAAREVVAGIRNLLGDREREREERDALGREPADLPSSGRRPLIVAVDLPSGVDPDTGAVADDVVLPADLTVTFGGIKAGLLQGRGAVLAGEVVLAEIGIEAGLATTEPAIVVP